MAAELAIVDARVRTLDPARPFARAVAVQGRRRSWPSATTCASTATRAPRSSTRAAPRSIPGLMDSHMHPFWGAELARGVDLSHVPSKEEVLAALARRGPHRGWLFAWGLDYDAAPTPPEIAEAVGGAAAFVRLADLHTALATPRALELAQVTGPVDFPDGSEVVVTSTASRPASCTSRARRNWSCAPRPRCAGRSCARATSRSCERLNALGLTGAHVMDGEPETFELLRDLEGTGELTLRLRVPLWMHARHDRRGDARHWLRLRDAHGRLWRGGVAKFFADGVIDAGTAWLQDAGHPRRGLDAVLARPRADGGRDGALRRRRLPARDAHDRRRRRALHARRLRARRRSRGTGSSTSRRCPTSWCAPIARGGCTASMQPVHLAAMRGDGSGNWNERLGPERAARAFRDARPAGRGRGRSPSAATGRWPTPTRPARRAVATPRARAASRRR